MDFRELMHGFGIDEETLKKMAADPFGALSDLMQGVQTEKPEDSEEPDPEAEAQREQMQEELREGFSGLFGGMSNLFGDVSGMFGELGKMFGGADFDLGEAVEEYQPAAEDAADRAFVKAMKEWLMRALREIPAKEVCMLALASHVGYDPDGTPGEDIWLAFNTAETDAQNAQNGAERWNFCNWTDDSFSSLEEAPFEAWRRSQGWDLKEDEKEMTERICDLAVCAVMELHAARFTEQVFGKKIPFVIEDYEYSSKTAVRAAKANGKELFDEAFFAQCGAVKQKAEPAGPSFEEVVAAYEPKAEDSADREFVSVLKQWIQDVCGEIPASDVCMLEIGYEVTFPQNLADPPEYRMWFAYNTAETDAVNRADKQYTEPWNFNCWTDFDFRSLPEEPFAAWRTARGYLDGEDEGMEDRLYDLAVLAVTELHAEQFTEQKFGRKVPVLIEGIEYWEKTAIRAVKANGRECFDSDFFALCGIEEP